MKAAYRGISSELARFCYKYKLAAKCSKNDARRNTHNKSNFTYFSFTPLVLTIIVLRPSRGFWGTGEKGIYFRGTGEQRQYWGTGNIRKQIFDFWGTGEQANLYQGNMGTGTPLGGPLYYLLVSSINIVDIWKTG